MTSVQEFSCIFCQESFEDKETLQIHFRKHGDPKFNHTTKGKRNQNESPTSSEATKNDTEMVSCDVCSEEYPTISKAITHKHKVHPDHDAKYFCPWCGKLFTLKYLYHKHLQSSHDAASSEVPSCFHCDCCNVDFFIPSAMIYHNKFFHRQDTDIPDVGHSKKVKLLCQELVQIYYCPFCGEEYDNKINLHKHTVDDHSDENQRPEDVLRCPLCEAVFYHLDAYELHLTFHSSEDLYSEENEMLKQIIEFSLDTVPPLMEKVETAAIIGDCEDMNAMGIDQFLQLTMSKDPEEEQGEHVERVKSKKHKKHKKSKKAITLDEFLNMNTDVFGEGLNFQGIEEVPTRVVAKQLKSIKEPGIKSNHKNVLPSDIDKLKKQGITIKMKSGKKSIPSNVNQNPSSVPSNRTNPMKSNVISTSSEVLSKLMNQSNSQIKIVKKTASTNFNTEQNSNEKIITKELTNVPEDKYHMEESNHNDSTASLDVDKDLENINTPDSDNNIEDPKKYATMVDVKETGEGTSVLMDTIQNICSDKTLLNETLNSNNGTSMDNKLLANFDNSDNIENEESAISSEISSSCVLNNVNEQAIVESGQTLNDFEEDLASTKILRANILENINMESLSNDASQPNEKNYENNEISKEQEAQNVKNDTLNAIKHLSHFITVKSINHSKSSPSGIEDDAVNNSSQDQVEDSHQEKNAEVLDDIIPEDKCIAEVSKVENLKEPNPTTLNALKNISKHVTIKSLTSQASSPKIVDKLSDEIDDIEKINDAENGESAYRNLTKNIVGRKVVNLKNQNKPDETIRSVQVGSPKHGTTKNFMIKKTLHHEIASDTLDECINNSNVNLLKRLTNVTAKSIPSKMHIKQQQIVQTSVHSVNIKKGNTERVSNQEKITEEIEIFNIDDSDSDGQDKQEVKTTVNTSKLAPLFNKTKNINSVPKSYEALRNLGKAITVKSRKETTTNQSTLKSEETFSEQNAAVSNDEDINYSDKKIDKSMNKFINQTNINLKSALKNLGKHITVKSRNSSPNFLLRKQPPNKNAQNEMIYENDTGSDSDSTSCKVKITELTDNTASDNEFLSDEDERRHDKNFFVQSPTATNSDMEDNNCAEEENDEQFSDLENQNQQAKVKMKTSEKPYQSPSTMSQIGENEQSPISNLKKLNKEITIKSLNEKKINRDIETELGNTINDSDIKNNVGKEMNVKPCRPNVSKHNIKHENQATSSTLNEKVGTTSNQLNTVNKEVSVKTFQTQTVIEEITTTVTKTVRTVNQTVNQEIRNTTYTPTTPTFKPQKIVNYNQQGKNTQNITVRHPSPSIGTKIKNATVKPTSFRANQLVPVRPGLNFTKACNPTMPIIRNVTPSKPAQQNPIKGRPLKISPQAMNQSMKRPSQDTTGQFSCFKKPKEFSTEMSKLRGEQEGEATMHFSASQSRSDFTSTVKNVKGKSTVTSTQMRSEMNTSSKFSKLGNMSGQKIMKSCSKQATHVEEREENCGAKRTMEALQKLQMQGLLVKRPRSDSNEENDFSNSDSENEEEICEK